MTKYKHIVQVHTLIDGESTMKWVVSKEFDKQTKAEKYAKQFNAIAESVGIAKKAVYLGRVNDATGELE
jgi:GH35 family endo-1,4-beta-xylanase